MLYTLPASPATPLAGHGKLVIYLHPHEDPVQVAVTLSTVAIGKLPEIKGWIGVLHNIFRSGRKSPVSPEDRLALHQQAQRGKIVIDTWKGQKVGLTLQVDPARGLTLDLRHWQTRHGSPQHGQVGLCQTAIDELKEVMEMTEELLRMMSIST